MGKSKGEVEGMGVNFWHTKKTLITGHTGFKGAWLCKILERCGADVIGYALAPVSEPNLYNLCKTDIKSFIGDIRDFDRLLSVFNENRPEIVIHMAAQPLVLDSYKKPRYTYDVNVMGTVNILECIHQSSGVKSFLNVTTDKVYFNLEKGDGYKEDEKLCGLDPYSNSKSCSELISYSYSNAFLKTEGISVSTARSGNVIGGGDFSENRIIPDCAKFLSDNEAIKIRNPNSVRPYQHVLDTLFAYLLIAEKQYVDSSYSGSYNIGPKESDCVTNGILADYFCNAWGNGAKWEQAQIANPHESGLLKLNCDKIKQSLNWTPKWNTQHAVFETARWYKSYYGNDDYSGVMEEQIEEFFE